VPMLPVTHGILHTKKNIFAYTVVLFFVTLLPYFMGLSGGLYLVSAIILSGYFCYLAYRLLRASDNRLAMPTFKYSIIQLMLLFVALIADHIIVK